MNESQDYTEEYNDFVSDWLNPSVKTIHAHTSGSTGTPKTILLPKEIMKKSAERTIDFFGIDQSWILTSCISAKYIGGKMMAVRALEAECKLVCELPTNRPELRLARESNRKVVVSVVPSQMWHILTLPLTEDDKSRIRFLIGGSAIPQRLRDEIVVSGLNAWESYGMTETSSHIALRQVTDKDLPFSPLPGIELSKSQNDTLIIRNAAEAEIITNDLVEFDKNGNFRILGRLDNVIISGGLKIIPEKVEEKIKSLLSSSPKFEQIKDIMISSSPDDKWGAIPILLIEMDSQAETYSTDSEVENRKVKSSNSKETPEDDKENSKDFEATIQSYLQQFKSSVIPPHEFPKSIQIVGKLPRTPNGKLLRISLTQ